MKQLIKDVIKEETKPLLNMRSGKLTALVIDLGEINSHEHDLLIDGGYAEMRDSKNYLFLTEKGTEVFCDGSSLKEAVDNLVDELIA